MLKQILDWDREAFIYLNSLGIENYDNFWSIVTNITTWSPLFALFLLLLLLKYPLRQSLLMILTIFLLVGMVIISTDFTKEFVARLRPNNNTEINTLIRILRSPTNYSFYSGHAASSFAVTTLVVLFLRKKVPWVWGFYIWPLVFSFSRIYVGVHYPIDIMVGALAGSILALLFYFLYHRLIEPYLNLGRPVPGA